MPNVDAIGTVIDPITTLVTARAIWMLPALLIVAAIRILLLPKLRGIAGERQVGAVLDRIGADALHDIVLPDGRGGSTQIDHVVLTGAGLLVVETKNYSGSIFGQERESQWTMRLGRRSFRFQNPLRQNYGHTQAVKALVPGVPVFARVVFTDSARFPQGMPDGVSRLRDLRRDLREAVGDAPPSRELLAAWEVLKGKADRSKAARKAHLDGIRERRGPDRARSFAWGLLVAAPLCMAALWMWQESTPGRPTRTARSAVVEPAHAPISHTQTPARLQPQHGAAVVETATPGTPNALGAEVGVARAPLAARPSSVPRQGIPVPTAAAPLTLEWSDRGPQAQEDAQTRCHGAIAALLVDNSAENRARRDRACAPEPAAVVRPR